MLRGLRRQLHAGGRTSGIVVNGGMLCACEWDRRSATRVECMKRAGQIGQGLLDLCMVPGLPWIGDEVAQTMRKPGVWIGHSLNTMSVRVLPLLN